MRSKIWFFYFSIQFFYSVDTRASWRVPFFRVYWKYSDRVKGNDFQHPWSFSRNSVAFHFNNIFHLESEIQFFFFKLAVLTQTESLSTWCKEISIKIYKLCDFRPYMKSKNHRIAVQRLYSFYHSKVTILID